MCYCSGSFARGLRALLAKFSWMMGIKTDVIVVDNRMQQRWLFLNCTPFCDSQVLRETSLPACSLKLWSADTNVVLVLWLYRSHSRFVDWYANMLFIIRKLKKLGSLISCWSILFQVRGTTIFTTRTLREIMRRLSYSGTAFVVRISSTKNISLLSNYHQRRTRNWNRSWL